MTSLSINNNDPAAAAAAGVRCTHEEEGVEGSDMMMMNMQMFFYVSNKSTILFKGWKTDSDAEMFGSVLAVVFLGILCEAIKFYNGFLRQEQHQREYMSAGGQQQVIPGARFMCADFMGRHHLLMTLLHLLQVGLSFLLMLVAMTFNLWLFLAVILGSTLGFFLFSWKHPPAIAASGDHC